MPAQTKTPVRRRPANRRHQIIVAAGELFAERGFHNVSLAQVAAAVDITAPSVYRHFRDKKDLLRAVVHDAIEGTDDLVSSVHDVPALMAASASWILDHRIAPTIWQREARHLPSDDRTELWGELAVAGLKIAALVVADRPELSEDDARLLAWAQTAVFSSVSRHRIALPRRGFEQLLAELGTRAVSCQLEPTQVEAFENHDDAAGGLPSSTRENLLNVAVRLFDLRGFASVSTDDIGEAAGTSGPNIYKYFSTKTEMLEAAVARAGERRRAAIASALALGGDARARIDALLRAYVGFALENRHLLGLLVSEIDHLPERQQRAARQTQREFIAMWAELLDEAEPGQAGSANKITVIAALSLVDDLVRTPPMSQRSDLAQRLIELSSAVLTTSR